MDRRRRSSRRRPGARRRRRRPRGRRRSRGGGRRRRRCCRRAAVQALGGVRDLAGDGPGGGWHIDVAPLRGEPSRRIWAGATSRSTRWRCRSVRLDGAVPSIRPVVSADLEGRLLRAMSPSAVRRTTRCGCCVPRGSRRALGSSSMRARRRWRGVPQPGRASRRASASLRSCACCSPARRPFAGSSCSTSSGRPQGCCPSSRHLRGVEQNPNHHLDVHGHTIEVLDALLEVEADLRRMPGSAQARWKPFSPSPLPTRWTGAGRSASARSSTIWASRRRAGRRAATSPSSATTASAPTSRAASASGCARAAALLVPGRDHRQPPAPRLPDPRAPARRAGASSITCAPPIPTALT